MRKSAAVILCIIALLLASGCISDTTPSDESTLLPCGGTEYQVHEGVTVRVEYTMMGESGELLDSGTVEFVSSAGKLIKGFEEAVMGMCLGEEKDVVIPPDKAHGYHNPELVLTVPLTFERVNTFHSSVKTFVEKLEPPVNYSGIYRYDVIMPLKVVGIIRLTNDDNVSSGSAGGDTLKENELWSLSLISVNETTMKFVRNAENGTEVLTYVGTRTVEVADGNIMLDLNHNLAGKTLCFHIKVLEIRKA
jgi:FKBP-type peptidyl-prolyl cis-trans isomerase 2